MPAPPLKTELADAYPNPSNAVFRAGIGKLWDALFGTGGLLGASGTAADARDALGVGTISFRNVLDNGGFSINQHAVSGSVVLAASAFGHDRWKGGASGCSYTFASSGGVTTLTISAGSLSEVVEAENIETGNYTLSWSGTAQGRLNNSGAYAASPITAALTAGSNIYVEFNTGTLSKVQLERGAVATPFERRSVATEMVACRNFFRTSYQGVPAGTAASSTNRLIAFATQAAVPGVQFAVAFGTPMRATPTITLYNPSTGAVTQMRDETVGANFSIATLGSPGRDGFTAANSASPTTVGSLYSVHYTASAEI